jgi:hypothetical protein
MWSDMAETVSVTALIAPKGASHSQRGRKIPKGFLFSRTDETLFRLGDAPIRRSEPPRHRVYSKSLTEAILSVCHVTCSCKQLPVLRNPELRKARRYRFVHGPKPLCSSA